MIPAADWLRAWANDHAEWAAARKLTFSEISIVGSDCGIEGIGPEILMLLRVYARGVGDFVVTRGDASPIASEDHMIETRADFDHLTWRLQCAVEARE